MTEIEGQERFPAQWALDLLEHDERIQHGFLYNYWTEICFAAFGAGVPIGYNRYTGRPWHRGWPLTLLSCVALTTFGYWGNKNREYYAKLRDENLRQYVRLHPELFPEPKRLKYADVLQSWRPAR